MTVTEAQAAVTAAGYNLHDTAAGPDRGIGVNIADHPDATVYGAQWSAQGSNWTGNLCADINPADIWFMLRLYETSGGPGTDTTYVDCPNVFVNWTWSETPGTTTTYFQTVDEYLINGVVQSSYELGSGFNNSTATFRSTTGTVVVNAPGKFLPCEAGVPIDFACDLRYQGSPGSAAELKVAWYRADGGTISTETLFPAQALSGWEHVTATLTPPATAVKWNMVLHGLIDNVTASTL